MESFILIGIVVILSLIAFLIMYGIGIITLNPSMLLIGTILSLIIGLIIVYISVATNGCKEI